MVAIYGTTSFYSGKPFPDRPFACRVVLNDVPETVIGAIRSMPPNCIAVTVSTNVRKHHVEIERAARRRGVRVLWDDRFRRAIAKLRRE